MLNSLNAHLIQPLRGFSREARLFLTMSVIYGIIMSAWQLFFNIYMIQSGFERDFLGIINSIPSLAGLLMGIPVGKFADRFGSKTALVTGIFFSSLTFLGQVGFKQPFMIATMSALNGIFFMMVIVSESPLMMRLSNKESRATLFSLNFGLQTLAGAVGSLFAGQMPAMFGEWLNVDATSAAAYQAVLIVSVFLGMTALIPLWMMKDTKNAEAAEMPKEPESKPTRSPMRSVIRLAAPNFLIGIGAAILVPYMNVFFKDEYAISDANLGILFGVSSLLVGVASVIGPRLAGAFGKIKTIVFTQFASVIFLLLMGFSGNLWIAAIAFLMRGALMNMSAPLYSAFAMEQTPDAEHGFMSSVLNIAWQIGWSVFPYFSGLIQESSGFPPLFIATTTLYLSEIIFVRVVFWRSEIIKT